MAEKKSWNQNLDAAFGSKFRISRSFPRRKQKMYICFFFEKACHKF
jgi:hypothetical protein